MVVAVNSYFWNVQALFLSTTMPNAQTARAQRLLHFELQTSFLVTYYGLPIYILIHPVISSAVSPPTPAGDYDIGLEQLVSMSKDQNVSAFQQYGGASLKICCSVAFRNVEVICFANTI